MRLQERLLGDEILGTNHQFCEHTIPAGFQNYESMKSGQLEKALQAGAVECKVWGFEACGVVILRETG